MGRHGGDEPRKGEVLPGVHQGGKISHFLFAIWATLRLDFARNAAFGYNTN